MPWVRCPMKLLGCLMKDRKLEALWANQTHTFSACTESFREYPALQEWISNEKSSWQAPASRKAHAHKGLGAVHELMEQAENDWACSLGSGTASFTTDSNVSLQEKQIQ